MDHDAALRARVLLLGTGRLGLLQEVTAYRALVPFSPAVYAPKLARALVVLSRDPQVRHLPEARLALLDEAVAAARGTAADDPRRPEILVQALRSRQLHLYDLGRRAEGLAVREEMAALARAAAPGSPLARRGPEEWADALAGRAGLLPADDCSAAARPDAEESPAYRPQTRQCSVGTPPPSTRATSVPVRPRPQRPVIPASRSASGGVLPRPTA